MKKKIRDIFSNYLNKLIGLVTLIFFVPIYIKFLGVENYAIISLYTLLFGIISFADSGISASIIRELAKDSHTGYKYSVLRRLEHIYFPVCLVIMFIIWAMSKQIAYNWLVPGRVNTSKLSYYVSLIGVGVSLQLYSTLYFGALFGLQQQFTANIIQVIWNICKSFLVVFILIYYKKGVEFFLLWQILCNISYVVVLRYFVIKSLKERAKKLENHLEKIPIHILKYIGSMFVIAIISSINSQADKIITTHYFSLETYGIYSIASTLAQVPIILASPLALYIFPILSKFTDPCQFQNLNQTFKKFSFLLNIVVIPVTLILIFYTPDIINFWLSTSINKSMLPLLINIVRLLSIGSFFLALQFPLYYLLMSNGETKYTIIQGFVQIVIGIPLLLICAKYYGVSTVPVSWILINLGSWIYLTIIVQNRYIKIKYMSILKNLLFYPLVISLMTTLIIFILNKFILLNFVFLTISSFVISLFMNITFNNFKNKVGVFSIKELFNFPN